MLAISLLAAQAFAQEAPSGAIRGQVVQAGTGVAIADADVLLQPAPGLRGPQPAPHTKSDRDGRFEVSGIPVGKYTLTVAQDGYFANQETGAEAAVIPLLIEGGGNAAQLSVILFPAAVLSGRVIDFTGQLLPLARVRAFLIVHDGDRETLKPAATRVSDNRGEFRLFGLSPGEYAIQAEPPDSGPGLSGPSTRAFYPNATELARASRLTLKAGDVLSGIDVALPIAIPNPISQPSKISGQVFSTLNVGEPGVPAAAALTLLPHDSADESLPRNAGASDSKTGRFEISPVAPGVYDVYARVQDPKGSPARAGISLAWGRAVVDLRKGAAENVTLIVHPSVFVSGFVKGAGGVKLPPEIRVELEAIGSSAKFATVQGMTDVTRGVQPDGSFMISAVAEGTYKVRLRGLPLQGCSFEVRQGGVDVTESGIEVTAVPPSALEVVVRGSGPDR